MMRPLLRLFALVLLCATAASAQFNGPADTASDPVNAPHAITTDLAILFPPKHDTVLSAGDQLRLSIYGISDYNYVGRITEQGFVTVPLISPVPIAGLTVDQAENLVSQRLQDAEMFRNAAVQIEVTESVKSQIVLIGEVRATVSGLQGSRRLYDVLASAGGLQPTTSHVITIDRPGQAQAINVDLGTDPERSRYSNIPVFPGDTILTSRIGNYYLVGAWKSQGAFPLTNTTPLTLMQAYTIANGKNLEARANELHLIRTIGTTRTLTIVKMDEVLKGKQPDPVLQTDDILYLPSNKVLAAIRQGGVTTGLGLALTLFAALQFH